MRRLHRLLQRLHAPRHRQRHQAAIEQLLEEQLQQAPSAEARAALLRRAVRDAAATFCRNWMDEIQGATARGLSGSRVRLDSLRGDVAFAWRLHRRRPIYALVTVATLTLAVGANTAIYTVAEAALFRSLPFDAPDRIVEIRDSTEGLLGWTPDWAPSELLKTTAGVERAATFIAGGGANLVAESGASRLTLTQVSEDFFELLGVELVLGSGFAGTTGDPDVVVLANSVWRQAFGSDPSVLGRTIRLSGLPYRVVGVAPAEVGFPGGTEAWVPQPLRWAFFSDAVGPTLIARLAPGADRLQVEGLLQARTQEARDQTPYGADWPPRFVPLRGALTESVRAPLFVLIGAAVMVFLLGCLNLAGVAVSHFLRRSEELRIRAAVGAGRSRVMRQLVVEALVLGALGAAAGLAMAAGGIDFLLAWLPGDVPGLSEATLGGSSVILAAGLAAVAALIVNCAPAMHVVRNVGIDGAARTATESRNQTRVRSVLAVGQVAVALLLVTSAGLLGKSLIGLARTPLGIDVDSVLTFETHLPEPHRGPSEDDQQYAERTRAARDLYLEQVQNGLATITGVLDVGAVSQLPLSDELGVGLRIRTPEMADDAAISMSFFDATTGYFAAVGIGLIGGRTFSRPGGTATRELIISRGAARELFGAESAVGREVFYGGHDWKSATVVGVVEDVRRWGPETDPRPTMYTSLHESADLQIGFAVRTTGDPGRLADVVLRALADIDPTVPPYHVQTTRQALSRQLSARQTLAAVSSLFAVTALALASLGIYGLISESVVRRRREIGIRIALGAQRGKLVKAVAAHGLLLASAGAVVAVPPAFWGSRLLDDVLYNVSSRDPLVLVSSWTVLLLVAALAAWVPARKAAHVDPVEVLAAE